MAALGFFPFFFFFFFKFIKAFFFSFSGQNGTLQLIGGRGMACELFSNSLIEHVILKCTSFKNVCESRSHPL
jgi:hypothetical protein